MVWSRSTRELCILTVISSVCLGELISTATTHSSYSCPHFAERSHCQTGQRFSHPFLMQDIPWQHTSHTDDLLLLQIWHSKARKETYFPLLLGCAVSGTTGVLCERWKECQVPRYPYGCISCIWGPLLHGILSWETHLVLILYKVYKIKKHKREFSLGNWLCWFK